MEREDKGKEVGGAGCRERAKEKGKGKDANVSALKRKKGKRRIVHTSKTAGLDANEGSVRSKFSRSIKCRKAKMSQR